MEHQVQANWIRDSIKKNLLETLNQLVCYIYVCFPLPNIRVLVPSAIDHRKFHHSI